MRNVMSKDGTFIAFDQLGEGPVIILVGGATATRLAAASLAATLASHFTVFAYDRRGRGDSGDTTPYAIEREVEDIEALIDEAGGSAFVFGHSSGAVLALDAALQFPTKITKLALYEPPFIIDNSRPLIPENFVSHLIELIAANQRGAAVEYFMTKGVGLSVEMIAQMRQSSMWPELEKVAPTLVYDGTIVESAERGDPSSLRQWETVAVPTLVMNGGISPVFMQYGAQELARILPNAQRCILEGQDHGPANEVLVPALQEFFIG